MVHTCCTCKWRSDKKPPRSFHKFPTNESEKIKWLEILGKNNERLGSQSVVCSLHFNKDCFRYGAVKGRAFLKQGSLPTLHLPSESAVTSDNSFDPCSSTESKSVSPADVINFCDSTSSSSTPTIKKCLNNDTIVERTDDVIEEPPAKKFCLDKAMGWSSIERNQKLYMETKLKEKTNKILSLKRQNQRLRKYKSIMKRRMQELQKEHKAEKKLMHVSILIAKEISKSNFL